MAISRSSGERSSLRDGIWRALRRRIGRPKSHDGNTLGSGILRRDPSYIASSSTIKMPTFPDFGSALSQIEKYDIHRLDRYDLTSENISSYAKSRPNLLPATSLSQFNLRQMCLDQARSPEQIVYEAVPPMYTSGASFKASVTSIYSHSLRPSASTLRIRDSRQSLSPDTTSSYSSRRQSCTRERQRLQQGFRPRRSHQKVSRNSTHDQKEGSLSAHSLKASKQQPEDPIPIIEHFKLFCVLDTAIEGCPVTTTSQELRYIFEVGERFFLNNQECEGTSMDVVTGFDANGQPITHLVLFSPLVSPSSGRSRFMLASLIDVTQYLQEMARPTEWEGIDRKASVTEIEVNMPSRRRLEPQWIPSRYEMELSAEDLLGGCYLTEDGALLRSSDDIWLNLATEEMSKKSYASSTGTRSEARTMSTCQTWSSTTGSTTSSSPVDEALDSFITELQELYSDFFLLGRSPLEDNFYEICNVSPRVYTSKEYVEGHLSQTPPEDLNILSEKMAREHPFRLGVKWGMKGVDKELYCSPLYGQSSTTWVCFLVNKRNPILW